MKRFISLTVACGLLWFIGCEKHDHSHDDEHKVPGSFILYLISEGGDTLKATWQDPDGPGGNPPEISPINLEARHFNRDIRGILEIFATDGDTLTTVIRRQSTEHQLFWSVEGAAKDAVTITVTDRDSRGMPLGLETLWQVKPVQAPTPGNVRIILYHYEPNKKDGTSPSPETDADIQFPLTVQP